MPAVTLRPPSPADAEAVLDVILARDVADLGRPDFTLADVRADWATTGVTSPTTPGSSRRPRAS